MVQGSDVGSLVFERRLIGAICCAFLGLASGAFYILLIELHLT